VEAPGGFVLFLEMKDFEQEAKENNKRAEGIDKYGNKENMAIEPR